LEGEAGGKYLRGDEGAERGVIWSKGGGWGFILKILIA